MIDLIGIKNELLNTGNISLITKEVIEYMNLKAMESIHSQNVDDISIAVLQISDILYNNSDLDILPLEDGVYDILFELANKQNKIVSIGAPSVVIQSSNTGNDTIKKSPVRIFDKKELLFKEELYYNYNVIHTKPDKISPVRCRDNEDFYINKRNTNSQHVYPELVGSLLKSKFVLNSQAKDRGVFDDDNVRILERDFFQNHISKGILDPNRRITMVLTIKYDGVSVEAECNSMIVSARSRGDAIEGNGADLTPIFGGYTFNKIMGKTPDEDILGINFEAIISKNALNDLNTRLGSDYKNCRTAIVGVLSSSNSYALRDYITLVPLKSSMGSEYGRVAELEFLNKYYANSEPIRYAVISGTYKEILFQIKKFVDEAEALRESIPFMYDGVVVEYLDDDLIEILGRQNAINLYAEAVKFNALKRQTIFSHCSYTVGQDGTITPMIHYNPVEFFGTIHPKSSGHSYKRFTDLSLREGDIVELEYVGDVMPYITKPKNSHNENNTNPLVEFTNQCPSCGNILKISDSGKTKYCDNRLECPGIRIGRLVSMMSKLNVKDFGESHLERIDFEHFSDLMEITLEDAKRIFPTKTMPYKLMERIESIKNNPVFDYQIVGSLGFTNIGRSNWKKILEVYSLPEILSMTPEEISNKFVTIDGIGPNKVKVILEEMPYFMKDLLYINSMSNVKKLKDNNNGKKIRFTGVRDAKLTEELKTLGHDVGEGSVTKDTDILIVPLPGHTSSKVTKANKYGIPVIPIQEFKDNITLHI